MENTTLILRWDFNDIMENVVNRYNDLMIDNKFAIAPSIRSVDDLDNYKFLEITDWDTSYDINVAESLGYYRVDN